MENKNGISIVTNSKTHAGKEHKQKDYGRNVRLDIFKFWKQTKKRFLEPGRYTKDGKCIKNNHRNKLLSGRRIEEGVAFCANK